jgi:hypothetical protein
MMKMMKGKLQLAGIVALALLAGLAAEPAFAQGGRGQRLQKRRAAAAVKVVPPQPAGQTPPPQTPPDEKQPVAGETAAHGKTFVPGGGPRAGIGPAVPPQWMERLHQMPPQDQERFMNNNQRFRNLPPERQAEIRERLRRWNNMPPAQQEEMRRRQRVLEALSPEERRRVREEILPRWQQLPPERRQPIMRRLRALNDMAGAERDALLKDENFLHGLSMEDREMLRELARLRVGSQQEPPPDDNPPMD